jgi:high-affinity Fe2+/Pb2+ permease
MRYEFEEPYRSLIAGAAVLQVLFAILAGMLTLVIVGGFLRVGVGSVYEAVVALLFLATAVLFWLATWRFDTPAGWWAGFVACGLTALTLLTFPFWASALCAVDGLSQCVPRGAGHALRIGMLPFLAAAGLLLIRRP